MTHPKFTAEFEYLDGLPRSVDLMVDDVLSVELFYRFIDDMHTYGYAFVEPADFLEFMNGNKSYREMVRESHFIVITACEGNIVECIEMNSVEFVDSGLLGEELTMTPKQLSSIKNELALHGFN